MNEEIERAFQNFFVDHRKIPVCYMRYNGHDDTYVTYMETDKDNSFSGDDELLGYVSYYDMDIYSKGNYKAIVKAVRNVMKSIGFTYQPSRDSQDMYEDDTGYYHKTLCFAIEKEEE